MSNSLDLDALERDFQREDIHSTPADSIVLALIQRLREAENATPNLKEWFSDHDSILISKADWDAQQAELGRWKAGQVHKNNAWMHARIVQLERVREAAIALSWASGATPEAHKVLRAALAAMEDSYGA